MDIPRELKDRLRDGRVIPFVGAGVSMAVKDRKTGERLFPSWKALLERAADRLDQETKGAYADTVRGLLKLEPPDYLDAAKRARSGMGAVWFRFLKEQLDYPREAADDESLKLASSAWGLGSQLIITTNYDKTLHWASPQRENLVIWDIEAPAEQAGAIRGGQINRPTVWHLHGYIDNAANLILTPDGYTRLYPEAGGQPENRYAAALSTLHQFMTSHTLLFIGFSLDDAYFGMQLRGISEIFKGSPGPHYVLTRSADRERIKALNLPVHLLTVEEYGPSLVDAVQQLGKIATEAKRRAKAEVPALESILTAHVATYDPRNSVFHVPYRSKGDQVVGREETILSLRDQLTQGRRTAIGQTAAFEGLGGLGKTQLAVEYAYRYQGEYPNGVIWLNADQDIDAQLTELAEKARWVASEAEHKYKLEIGQRRLRTYSECLIVFDNVESLNVIEDYLPEPNANPHLLITSRTEQPGFTPVPIDLLDIELSLRLLLQEAGRRQDPKDDDEWAAAREIAKTLDGLPLALEIAGAYIRYRQLRWQDYANLLMKNLKAALPGRFLGGSFTRHEKDIYSTLKINEEVFSEEPNLLNVLNLLTWSGSASMGLSLICSLLDVSNSADLTSALSLGTALHVLQKSPGSERYAIHRLVREVRREDLPLAKNKNSVNKNCRGIGVWFEQKRERFRELPYFEAEIDHLKAWQQHALDYAVEYASRLTWLQAYPPYHRGRYRDSRKLIEKALELFEKWPEHSLELKAHLLSDLGFTYFVFSDYKRALNYAEQSLSIRLKSLGERHRDTAMSFNNVGVASGQLGDRKRALERQEKALSIQMEIFGEKDPDTAGTLGSLGVTFRAIGDYERALTYQFRALAIETEVLGEKDPRTATSLGHVGRTYLFLHRHAEALKYFEKSLTVRLEVLGDQHPDTTVAILGVADALSVLNRRRDALQLVERHLRTLQSDNMHYEVLKRYRQEILSLLPGFRAESMSKQKKQRQKSKGKRKRH